MPTFHDLSDTPTLTGSMTGSGALDSPFNADGAPAEAKLATDAL